MARRYGFFVFKCDYGPMKTNKQIIKFTKKWAFERENLRYLSDTRKKK